MPIAGRIPVDVQHQIAKYAPNFREAIMDKVVLTQQYFEGTFGVMGAISRVV